MLRRKEVLFHDSSIEVYNWLKKQPNVKEESLTDWLLYYISEQCNNIYYQEFSRSKEARIGADWEWWVLTSREDNEYNAYRFLVQAKKLYTENRDNYPLLSYSNKNGYQIDLLIEAAEDRNAYPLYMYYSITEPDVSRQIDEFKWIESSYIMWCKSCDNGCHLSPAQKVYDELYSEPRHRLMDKDVLNKSLKLSLLDLLFKKDPEQVLSRFNEWYKLGYDEMFLEKNNQGINGIQHYGEGIPDYLRLFIEHKGENVWWLQKEMRINDIEGIAVIDFRDEEE